MDEDDRTSAGKRIGDIFKWRAVPAWEVEHMIDEHALALEQLRAFRARILPSPE